MAAPLRVRGDRREGGHVGIECLPALGRRYNSLGQFLVADGGSDPNQLRVIDGFKGKTRPYADHRALHRARDSIREPEGSVTVGL